MSAQRSGTLFRWTIEFLGEQLWRVQPSTDRSQVEPWPFTLTLDPLKNSLFYLKALLQKLTARVGVYAWVGVAVSLLLSGRTSGPERPVTNNRLHLS